MGIYCLKTFFFQKIYSRGLFICIFDTTQLSLTDAHVIGIIKPATLRCIDMLTDILIIMPLES